MKNTNKINSDINYQFLYSLNNPYPIFLMIAIIYSGMFTHKNWLTILNMSFDILTNIIILINGSLLYIDAWIYILIALIVLNYRLKVFDKISKYFENKILLEKNLEDVYNQFFQNVFSRTEFKYLFDKAKRVRTGNTFYFFKEKDVYNKIYFFARVSNPNGLILRSQNEIIENISEGSWVGTIDFLNYQSNSQQFWQYSLSCEILNTEICYYEWDIEVIKNVFMFSTDYSLLNNILLVWSKSISENIVKLYKRVFDCMHGAKNINVLGVKSREKQLTLLFSKNFVDFDEELISFKK
jgi:hypothetical protein